MIKINLIAEGKKAVTRRAKAAVTAPADLSQPLLAGGLILGLLLFGACWFWFNHQIKVKQQQIAEAQKEVNRLAEIIKEVDRFKAQKAELEHKIAVINDLKANQRGPVRIMDQVSRALPELLWLDRMEVIGGSITLTGQAFNTNAVANFIENLDKVPEFTEPILRDTHQSGPVYTFVVTLTFNIKPPAAKQPAAAKPS